MNDTTQQSRRHFLRTVALGGGGYALSLGRSDGQTVDMPISTKLSSHINEHWQDQYGKSFKMDSLEKKPYVLIFGYNGCQYCNLISQNLARLRAVDDSKVQDVPVVVVNVTPDVDRKDSRDYVAGYYANGVCQSQEEAAVIKATPDAQKLAAAQSAYDTDKDIVQADRKFHLVFPPSNKAAQDLEDSMGVTRDPTDDQSHGVYMALVDASGKCIVSEFAATSNKEKCETLVKNMTAAIAAFDPAESAQRPAMPRRPLGSFAK